MLGMKPSAPEFIYKIFTAKQWQGAENSTHFPIAPIDESDGFIHLSTALQLAKTLELYFFGQSNVEILAISTKKIAKNLRWEESRGGDLFPHHYGPLQKTSIEWQLTFDVPNSGIVELPAKIT